MELENSIFLARILGPYCLIIGFGIFFNAKLYQKVVEEFFKNPALVYIGGAMALMLGLFIVQMHNVWAWDWRVIITIMGWMAILKGMWLILLPGYMQPTLKFYQQNLVILMVRLMLVIVFGGVLTLYGFYNI